MNDYQPGDRVLVFSFGYGDVLSWHHGQVEASVHTDAYIRVTVEAFDDTADRYFTTTAVADLEGQSTTLQYDPERGECTCHNPPRPCARDNVRSEWGHSDDDGETTYAEVFHVHRDTHSRDCDGPLDRECTYQVTSIVGCESKDDLWRKLCAMELTAHAIKQQIEIDGEQHIATFHETTDEGFSRTVLRGCHDPGCAHDGSSQRDHFAEAAGY